MKWFWKHNKHETPVVISNECHAKLPEEAKAHFEEAHADSTVTHEVKGSDCSSDFGLSMAVGMATNNAALGFIAGGDLGGAMVGNMLGGSGGMF